MSKDLEKAKAFIRHIPKHQLSKYKEIVFSEHEIEQRESDLAVNNLGFVLWFVIVQLAITLILWWVGFNDKLTSTISTIVTVCVFWVWVYIHNKKINTQSRNLYRLLYFLEHI